MEHRIESTGPSVDEALEKALAALGAKRADVSVEILDSGSSRFLGLFGGRQARVRVERLVHQHEDLRDLMLDLLQAMGISGEVELRQLDETSEILIRTKGLDGLLIGRRGQTLAALQHVVSRLASKEFGQDGHLVVDVGDYRKRREAHLVEKATALAEKVRTTGREINLEPLHAPDRRVVHLAVARVPGVRSYTVGQGLHRNVVIAPESRDVESEPGLGR
ncbi:MAG: RNA-binding cell elongation regulator Jag/EloR [Candidatus Krumholzibacteriia bacterium]